MSESNDQVKTAFEKAIERSNAAAGEEKPEMKWPIAVYPLVAVFDVQHIDLEDQDAIVIAMYTGAGSAFGLLSRENALALSSAIRKKANSIVEKRK